jgi:hypothetical protein
MLAAQRELDDREMKLGDAVHALVGSGSGGLISCIPGKLAYFQGEDRGEAYLLER